MRSVARMACLCALGLSFACGAGDGRGRVNFTTWGETIIEDGMGKELFPKDGWSVKYTRFLIVLGAIEVVGGDGVVGAKLPVPQVFDMTKKGDKPVVSFELAAKVWPQVSYQLGPITSDAIAGTFATAGDVATMQREGATVHVEGTATGPRGETKTFSWSFAVPTRYEDCHGVQGGKEVAGVVVANGGVEEVQLTIHGDHFFYDDLQSEEAVPRFAALANADANGDDVITLEELDAVPLYTIPPALGPYGTGALGDVNTLGDYERTLARTLGHYRGEGSCNSKGVGGISRPL